MKYSDLLQKLYNTNRNNGIKLGLDNIHKLSLILGNPEKQFKTIHVAGTNGKGSVVTKIAAAYQHAGKKVGLYTSPHIASFRERIKINGSMISEANVLEILPPLFESSIPATFFELATLLAFEHFAREKVEIAVLETGLGGRLDATNIVTPLISVITSISLEHTDLLGNTMEEIAGEKAGIIKPFTPVVIGPRVPRNIIQNCTNQLNCPLHIVEGSYSNYHVENNAIAQRTLEVLGLPSSSIDAGLKATPSCRMEYFPAQAVILDVAHNPDGLEQLFKALSAQFPGRTFKIICGLSKNKDIRGCVKVLQANTKSITCVESTNGRGLSVQEFKDILHQEKFHGLIKCGSSIEATVLEAIAAREQDELIVICGTFFIMAAARKALGIQEPADPFDLNEQTRKDIK